MDDLIIIGGSAAGSSAAVYAARRKLSVRMISEDFGGEVARSGEVWNYPGIIKTDGIALAEMFRAHVEANDVKPELGIRVESIVKNGEGSFTVHAKKGATPVTVNAKAVIVTTGVHPRHLNIPGESEFFGKGVTYCTTCDGPLYRNKVAVTIGGGNSALESALMLAEIANHVTVININDAFRGEQVLIDKVMHHPKITTIFSAETLRIEGEMVVRQVVYRDTVTREEHTVPTNGVFVHIGMIPNSGMMPQDVAKNTFKEVEVNQKCETSVPGLFAAGDVTNIPYKQIAIATGQGVIAALSAIEYINKLA